MVRRACLFSTISATLGGSEARCAGPAPNTINTVNTVNTVNTARDAVRAAKARNPVTGVNTRLLLAAVLLALPLPAAARDSLGVYSGWGAFRDPAVPRCYAIAMAEPSAKRRDYQPYASIGSWPRRQVRGQMHFRLSRKLAQTSRISLSIGGERFQLTGGGGDAWAADKRMDAAITAAMRSARVMTISARDEKGNAFSDRYALEGAATAMDSAAIGCARLR